MKIVLIANLTYKYFILSTSILRNQKGGLLQALHTKSHLGTKHQPSSHRTFYFRGVMEIYKTKNRTKCLISYLFVHLHLSLSQNR
jgi:hypothetical protein